MTIPDYVSEAVRQNASAEKGRSFYLYDTRVMQQKIQNLKSVLPGSVLVYYAMKANPHPAFLNSAKKAGAKGIEIASMGEGQKALDAGFTPEDIIFTGPGKTPDELKWAVQCRINKVHIESLAEAYRLNHICEELGKKQDILVRINPNFHIHGAQASFSGDSSKLGIDETFFKEALDHILQLPHLSFKGLHVYAASGVLQIDDLLENVRRVFKLARETESQHENLTCEIIDFGGGFGIDYQQTGADFSPETYAQELEKLIERFGFKDRTFVLELGRYLTADSGWYCTEIIDIKDSLGKKQIITAGGAHHFRRPVAIGINHPLDILPMNEAPFFEGQISVKDEMAFIGGPLCNTADKLAPKDIHIDHAEIGDYAVFSLAGAYGKTMSHLEFLSHPWPEEIIIGD